MLQLTMQGSSHQLLMVLLLLPVVANRGATWLAWCELLLLVAVMLDVLQVPKW